MGGQKTDERDIQLGRRIAERRKRAKLTQRIVAERFGMSAAQIQKYEKGTNRISAIHLGILSHLTGTPVNDLLAAVPQVDAFPPSGFAEKRQESLAEEGVWSGLASVVARHVQEHFDEDARRDFAEAVARLSRELKASHE